MQLRDVGRFMFHPICDFVGFSKLPAQLLHQPYFIVVRKGQVHCRLLHVIAVEPEVVPDSRELAENLQLHKVQRCTPQPAAGGVFEQIVLLIHGNGAGLLEVEVG